MSTASAPPAGSYSVHVHGQIVAVQSASEFQINGGSGVGYVNVYLSSTTTKNYNGLALKPGYYADVYATGSLSTKLTAVQVSLSTSATSTTSTTTSSTATAPSGWTVHVHGQIVAIKSASEFQINGGSGVGYVNVYHSSSTSMIYNGLSLKAGYYADVYGTGSIATSVTATQVSLSTSSTTSTTTTSTTTAPSGWTVHVKGPIVAIKSSSEIQINGGTNVGYVNVYHSSSTSMVYNGLSLKVGYYADVYGTGSIATSVTATQISLSSSSTSTSTSSGSTSTTTTTTTSGVPAHVKTAAIVWGYGGVPTSVPISSVKPYVTWVQTGSAYGSQMRAAGLKVDVYMNFWRNYSSDNPAVGYTDLKPGGAHAAAEAKTCTGSVIYDSTYGGGYEADARSSAAAGHAQAFATYMEKLYGGNYDALFSDDTGAMWGIPLPCNWSQSTYVSATNSVHASIGKPIFVNTIGASSNPVAQTAYANATNVIGAMCEICYAGNRSGSDYAQTGGTWGQIENAEIAMVQKHKIFWDYARAIGDPSTETPLRKFIYASFLLTYDPNYAMMQTAFKSSHAFPVMPETGLVPMNPVTTATSVTGYQRSGGAYMREFGACYYRGVNKGKCAVVVNPGTSTVTVPTSAYGHSLTLSGGGVLDGGSVGFSGGRPTSLAPGSAAILLP